jgi:hypothetical protein
MSGLAESVLGSRRDQCGYPNEALVTFSCAQQLIWTSTASGTSMVRVAGLAAAINAVGEIKPSR